MNLSPNREHLAQCEAPETDLTTDEAFVILEPYFLAAQELFLDAGLRKTERTRFYVAPWVHDSPRHFAATRDDGLAVMMAPEAAELPEGTVAAFFAHELGHATDFLYPGEWVLGEDRIAVRRERAEWTDEQWAKWIRSWESRDQDVVEFTADAIAEHVTGHAIGYLGPCLLQAFDRGKARPEGLR